MAERRVVNKYYPPDLDPSKIPKLRLPKDRQYVARLMAPFHTRCQTCAEHISKGRKFNARKETVQSQAYLGLPVFRFYIRCTRCLAEIAFQTDPRNTDYATEHGATRSFQAEKLLEVQRQEEEEQEEEKELNNPMKGLEKRTRDSKLEMEVLENLQEPQELQAHVDLEALLHQHRLCQEQLGRQQQEEDKRQVVALLREARRGHLLPDSDSQDRAGPAACDAMPYPRATQHHRLPKAKRKAHGWMQLAGLVGKKPKVQAEGDLDHTRAPGAPPSCTEADPLPQTPGTSALSQLGAYGDSEDSEGSI
ncbi:splicing factor YJU2-like [Thomomys bottae]